MADREKVIKGLECCGKGNMCRNHCPYDGPEKDIKNCTSQLARDALYLLKAQEPRVMTLEEVAAEEVGWVQDRDADELYAVLIIDVYADDTVGIKTADEDLEYWLFALDYNKKWRCWTACPTEEQRKRALWKD